MTVPVNSDTARSPHEPAETAQRDGSHRSLQTIMTERDLAELQARLELEECFDRAGLEARLKHDLQHSSTPPIVTEQEARLELEECFDRAGLEERLKHALQHSPSLPIAAPNGEVEWPRLDTGLLSRQTPLARSHAATGEADAPRFLRQAARRESPSDKRLEQLLIELKRLSAPGESEDTGPQSNAEAALNFGIARRTASVRPTMRGNEPIGLTEGEISPMRARAPADAYDLGDREFVEWPVPEPELAPRLDRPDDRAPLAPLPRPDQPSLFTRVTRAVAAVFSVFALVAVSGLTLVLVARGKPPATVTAVDAALAEQSTATAWSASMPLVPSKRVDAPTEISAIGGKQDMSRVSSEATAPARGGGTTRPLDTQMSGRFADRAQPAESWGVREASRSMRSVAMTMHVVAVVPAWRNAEVVDCTQWCEVVYDGWQGFIYRKFMSGAEQ